VERDFPNVLYSASDGVWEIYDEPKDSFLNAISTHETLDSFWVKAESNTSDSKKAIEIVFDKHTAKIACIASPEYSHWFEHFMIDLRKHILPPSFAQLVAYGLGEGRFYLRLPLLFVPVDIPLVASAPYCKIVIRKSPPDPFIENIKANLVSNVIWVIIVFLLGVLTTIVTQNISGR